MAILTADTKGLIQRVNLRIAELGIAREDFYQKAGISSASFSQWNTGRYSPSARKVDAMAKVLGVTTEYLLTGIQPEQKSPAPSEGDEAVRQRAIDEYVMSCDDPAELMRIIALAAKRNTEITGK